MIVGDNVQTFKRLGVIMPFHPTAQSLHRFLMAPLSAASLSSRTTMEFTGFFGGGISINEEKGLEVAIFIAMRAVISFSPMLAKNSQTVFWGLKRI